MSGELVEFLLARIAEDEATGHWYQLTPQDHGEVGRTALYREGRVQAECEAKRRIVSLCRDIDDGPAVEARLAVVYDDHPDYDETWRP